VLKQVVESSQQVMQAKICTIHFLEENGKHMPDMDPHFRNKYIEKLKPQIQQVIENKEPLLVENIDYNSLQFFQIRDEVKKLGLKSLIILPIIANDRTIAFLSVFLDRVHYFSEYEIEFLTMLAHQTAIAIENANLYHKAEKSKNYLESMIESSADLIVSTDINGNAIYLSNSTSRITGYAPDEIIHHAFFDEFVENGRALFSNLRKKLLTKNSVQIFESDFKTKNDQFIPISWSFSALINENKDIIGTVGIGKVISHKGDIKTKMRGSGKKEQNKGSIN
jgi:PAS domain S-box-containing protein